MGGRRLAGALGVLAAWAAIVSAGASAVTVYNSLHLTLPCVKAAILGSGTYELYRDLLSPGGIFNVGPGLVVMATIGGAALEQGQARFQRAPATGIDTASGIIGAGP